MTVIIIAYNTYMIMYNMEQFTNSTMPTIQCSRRRTKQVLPKYVPRFHYEAFKDTKNKHPLQFYGCINVVQLPNDIADTYYVTEQQFDSVSINNIYDKIVEDLFKTKLKVTDELLKDPIYIVIYQDPNCYDDDVIKTRLFIIYTGYDKHLISLNNSDINHNAIIDKVVIKNMHSCKGTVYTLNKNNKLFVNLLSEKKSILL